jgi:hypothetical protein
MTVSETSTAHLVSGSASNQAMLDGNRRRVLAKCIHFALNTQAFNGYAVMHKRRYKAARPDIGRRVCLISTEYIQKGRQCR